MSGDSTAKDYLVACLEATSPHSSETLLNLRRERKSALSPAPKGGVLMPRQLLPREEVEGCLRDLRNEFYELDPDVLIRRLERIDASDFPDLQRHIARLLRVAQARPEIRAARESQSISPIFVTALQEIFVLPERFAAEKKNRLLESMHTTLRREKIGQSASRLAELYPGVIALDPEFFRRLKRIKKTSRDGRRPKTLLMILGVISVINIVAKILRAISEGF